MHLVRWPCILRPIARRLKVESNIWDRQIFQITYTVELSSKSIHIISSYTVSKLSHSIQFAVAENDLLKVSQGHHDTTCLEQTGCKLTRGWAACYFRPPCSSKPLPPVACSSVCKQPFCLQATGGRGLDEHGAVEVASGSTPCQLAPSLFQTHLIMMTLNNL